MTSDLDRLQGAWTLRSLEVDGHAMPAVGTIEISGGRFRSLGMGAEYSGLVEIDETTKPKRIDLFFTAGPETGSRNPGIYRLDGDRLTLCLNLSGKSRPRSFTATPGSGNALEVLTRAEAAEAEPAAAVFDEATAGEGELVGEWHMVTAFQGGHELDEAMARTGRRITTATETTTYFGDRAYLKATYSTDPSASPKTIDLVARGGTQFGIYEVTGDTMRICFASPGRPRPRDFETRAGDGRTSAVWRRVKGARAGA